MPNKRQQLEEILDFVTSCAIVLQASVRRVPGKLQPEQWKACTSSESIHHLVANRLEAITFQVIDSIIHWAQVGQRHDLMSMLNTFTHAVA